MLTKMGNSKEHKLINTRILEFYVSYNKFTLTEIRKFLDVNWSLNFKGLYALYEDNLNPDQTGTFTYL